jgi:hypothetical protein
MRLVSLPPLGVRVVVAADAAVAEQAINATARVIVFILSPSSEVKLDSNERGE